MGGADKIFHIVPRGLIFVSSLVSKIMKASVDVGISMLDKIQPFIYHCFRPLGSCRIIEIYEILPVNFV